eukprot:TRINITY_DN27681_c0_g1_i1.p1 TRINITY_DN27681_c0_g1~~TRINITY_DN27681_c0_g1_i1.p1  ORF type:complete len:370 (-),score=69.58 TRINITY_DN27681_c0_g1_i1:278-1387(-)
MANTWNQRKTLAPFPFDSSTNMSKLMKGMDIGDPELDALPEMQVYHGMVHGDLPFRPEPDWVDMHAVERGAAVWSRFRCLVHLVLMCVLVQGFVIGRFSEILVMAGYARSARDAYERFLHTAQHINKWMDPKTRKKSLMQVRCMHAHARRRAMAFWKQQAARDELPLGVPLSQFDVAQVLLGFSGITLIGLQNLGCEVSAQEHSDFIHLWRYLGYHLGLDEEFNSCSSLALNDALCKEFLESLPQYVGSTRESCDVLTKSCVTGFGTYLGFGNGFVNGCLLTARGQPWASEEFLSRYECSQVCERTARSVLGAAATQRVLRNLLNFMFYCVGTFGLRYPKTRKWIEEWMMRPLAFLSDGLFLVLSKIVK